MRLKLLFFPIMVAISVAIFIRYVWPEIGSLKIINQEKGRITKSLQAVEEKQEIIKSLATEISSSSEDMAVVNSYLPSKKVEERIIGGVNYLAADSGVSLINISLKTPEYSDTAVQAASAYPVAAINSSINTLATATIPADNDITGDQSVVGDGSGMQFSEASIKIAGDYEKIRLFLDQVQKMSLLNNVKSLSITSNAKESADPSVSSTELSADMVVNFGYLESATSSVGVAGLQDELDKDTINTLKQYISQKTASVATLIGNSNKGKTNPFLP